MSATPSALTGGDLIEDRAPRGSSVLEWRKVAALGAAVSALAFAGGAIAASMSPYLPGDLPLARWIQELSFGPLVHAMELTNAIGGPMQTALAVAIAIPLAVWRWRAGLLVAMGIPAGQVEDLFKELTHRARPSAALVQLRESDAGFSFPSGHAAFYTWLAILVVTALWPHLPPRTRPVAVAGAAVMIVIACTGRVWAGAHWPSDVVGGLLFGLVWSWLAWRLWARITRPSPAPET